MDSSKTPIIIGSVVLVILVIVGLGFYFVAGDEEVEVPEEVTSEKTVTFEGKDQVFNVKENKFTYKDAIAVCKAHGARLASLREVIEAYKNGANWCNYGWSKGQLALYPTQKEVWEKLQGDKNRRTECGLPGVNGGYFADDQYLFGANCYGQKPNPKEGEILRDTDLIDPVEKRANLYESQLYNIKIAPFSRSKWSQHSRE